MRPVWLLGCAFLALPGCAGIKVADQDRNALPGIPFYVKSPRLVQETKRMGDQLSVQFELVFHAGSEKSVKHMPADGPAVLPPSQAAEDALRIAQLEFSDLVGQQGADRAIVEIGSILETLQEQELTPSPSTILSNSWKHEMVPGPEVHYVRSRIPFMGSASAQFEFAPDGTLTKLQTQTTEETASTLLSMIPVTAWLTKQWNLTKVDPSLTKSASPATIAILEHSKGLLPAPGTPVPTSVTMKGAGRLLPTPCGGSAGSMEG